MIQWEWGIQVWPKEDREKSPMAVLKSLLTEIDIGWGSDITSYRRNILQCLRRRIKISSGIAGSESVFISDKRIENGEMSPLLFTRLKTTTGKRRKRPFNRSGFSNRENLGRESHMIRKFS
jgi:hypothetical protein